MFSKMTLGAKIGFGFTLLLIIAALSGGISVWNMRSVESDSKMLASEYAPEVDIANNVERHVLDTSLNMRTYGLTFEKKFFDKGREDLELVKNYIAEFNDLAQHAPHLVKLKDALPPLSQKVSELEALINDTAKSEKEIERCRLALNESANAFEHECDKFIESQETQMTKDIKEDVSDTKKLERLHKLHLIGKIVEEGSACRVIVWKSQALRDSKLYEQTESHFAEIEKLLKEVQSVTHRENDLKELEKVHTSVNVYKAAMLEIKAAFIAIGEIGKKRAETAEALTASAREISLAGIKHT